MDRLFSMALKSGILSIAAQLYDITIHWILKNGEKKASLLQIRKQICQRLFGSWQLIGRSAVSKLLLYFVKHLAGLSEDTKGNLTTFSCETRNLAKQMNNPQNDSLQIN